MCGVYAWEGLADGTHRREQPGVDGATCERPRRELRPLVAVDDRVPTRPALVDGHAQRIGDERGTWLGVDRPADHSARPGVEDHGAVHLALSRRVLGDIGDPELVRLVTMKLPLGTIAGSGHAGDVAEARTSGDALNASAPHEHLDCLVTDGDALSEDQVGMDASDALGASRGDVHLADHVGEPDVADRAG